MTRDEALCDLLVAFTLYEAARAGVEIAVAGRWELELALRDCIRRLGAMVHQDAKARAKLERWLRDAVRRMGAGTEAMHVRVAGRGLVCASLAAAWQAHAGP